MQIVSYLYHIILQLIWKRSSFTQLFSLLAGGWHSCGWPQSNSVRGADSIEKGLEELSLTQVCSNYVAQSFRDNFSEQNRLFRFGFGFFFCYQWISWRYGTGTAGAISTDSDSCQRLKYMEAYSEKQHISSPLLFD